MDTCARSKNGTGGEGVEPDHSRQKIQFNPLHHTGASSRGMMSPRLFGFRVEGRCPRQSFNQLLGRLSPARLRPKLTGATVSSSPEAGPEQCKGTLGNPQRSRDPTVAERAPQRTRSCLRLLAPQRHRPARRSLYFNLGFQRGFEKFQPIDAARKSLCSLYVGSAAQDCRSPIEGCDLVVVDQAVSGPAGSVWQPVFCPTPASLQKRL